MTFGECFAGIGGFSLGLERAGMRCKWQVEIDPFCRKVLSKHWPDVPKYGDIRELGGNELGSVDLVCGGFPCQPFSSASAGKQSGSGDDRFLWPEMLRISKAARAAWILAENVTHLDRLALEKVVSDMEGSGYEVAATLEVPACAFGHDHRRSRLWIIGYSHSNRKSGLPVDAEASRVQGCNRVTRVMGRTDGFPEGLDKWNRCRVIGNAVVPQVSQWLGERIVAAHTEGSKEP